jgi:hypothetical protein
MIHAPIIYLELENFYYRAESVRVFVRHFEYIHHNKDLVAEKNEDTQNCLCLSFTAARDPVTIYGAWIEFALITYAQNLNNVSRGVVNIFLILCYFKMLAARDSVFISVLI